MTESWRARLIRMTLILAASSAAGRAFADPAPSSAAESPKISKSTCVSEYVAAQQDRLDGHLSSAQAHLQVCAQATCPPAVNVDCVQWLREIGALLPTVIFVARSPDGKDVPQARVFVDEHAELVDGRALSLDPGDHSVRVEAPGFSPTSEQLFVQQGERNRSITVTLQPSASTRVAHRGPPITAYVLSAAGIATVAIGAIVLASGIHDAKHLQASCKPNCSDDEVDSARAKIVVGNVGVGLGVAAVAGAVWVYLAQSPSTSRSAARGFQRALDLDLNVGPRASWAGLTVRF